MGVNGFNKAITGEVFVSSPSVRFRSQLPQISVRSDVPRVRAWHACAPPKRRTTSDSEKYTHGCILDITHPTW